MGVGEGLKKFLDVPRGLFLIRYESAEDVFSPPQLFISREGWAPSDLELVLAPDADEPALWSPGGCLVARVSRPGRVFVSVVPAEPGGSTVATLQLEPLSDDPLGCRPVTPVDLSAIKVLGHLSGIGDVSVGSSEWLGGPTAPARLEGIALEVPNLPSSIRLRYSARIGGANPVTTPMVDVGAYAGTRGRAMPLVGVAFEISGPGASQYMVNASGLFLGSPVTRISGQRVVLAGPTGREPLVGMQFSIAAAYDSSAMAEARATERHPPTNDKDRSHASNSAKDADAKLGSRVRVFRSRASRVNGDMGAATGDRALEVASIAKPKVKVFSREELKANRK